MTSFSTRFPWFKRDGEVADLMRHLDWSACAIGNPETWSPQLLNVIGLLLQGHDEQAPRPG
jgi:hypothetical protein